MRNWKFAISKSRIRAGFTQKALAKALGCSPSTVSQWENGKRAPSLQMVVAIAEAIDVAPPALALLAAERECYYERAAMRRLAQAMTFVDDLWRDRDLKIRSRLRRTGTVRKVTP